MLDRLSKLATMPFVFGLLLVSRLALAQNAPVLRDGINLDHQEIRIDRPLTLATQGVEAHAGVSINLSNGAFGEPLILPFGLGYGLIEGLEVGAASGIMLNRRSPLNFIALQSPKLYGRYAVLREQLALEAAVFVPVGKAGDHFGFRLEAPFRFALTPDLLLRGGLTYAVALGSAPFGTIHFGQLGAAVIYRLHDRFWAAVEIGLTLSDFSSAGVPLGVSAGYEIIPGIALLPGFRFLDVTSPAFRAAQILVVYTGTFGGASAAPPAQSE